MARALRIQYPGALYHVTNRGNERRALFRDDVDRKAFLQILSQSLATYRVVLHSFVLMENHWHILAQTPLGNLAEFMRHFNITYTSHYNRRHQRVGHLYQGRYKSFLVEADAYLSQVSRYIHLNPVNVSVMKRLSTGKRLQYLWAYPWSSLPGYIDAQQELNFVGYTMVLAEYGGEDPPAREKYKQQIIEDLIAGLAIRPQIVGQSILGSTGFVSWVRETYLNKEKDRERPDVGKIYHHLSKKVVLATVERTLVLSHFLQATGTARQIVMTALYTHAGLNNREIGELFGLDYSTVSQGRKRLREKIDKDADLKMLFQKVDRELSRIKI